MGYFPPPRLARRSIAASFRLFLTVAKGLACWIIVLMALKFYVRNAVPRRSQSSHADRLRAAGVSHAETDCLVKSALLKNPFLGGVGGRQII